MIKKGLSRLGIFFLYLISFLPFWLLYLFADMLFILIYHVFKYRRSVVQQNLANSFPEKSAAELKLIDKQYFKYLADLIMENIKLVSISERQLKRRLVVTNPEMISNYYAKGRSVIVVGGHYCNWEMAGLGFCFYTTNKFIVVYKPLTSAVFNQFFINMRSRFGTIPVSMKQTLRKMIEFKNEPSTFALLGDQTPVREDATYFTTFLNQPTAIFLGIEKLAKSMNDVVLFYAMKRVKRGYYTCTLDDLFENPKHTLPYEISDAHVARLEQCIRDEPQYWLWSHRRWKFKPGPK